MKFKNGEPYGRHYSSTLLLQPASLRALLFNAYTLKEKNGWTDTAMFFNSFSDMWKGKKYNK